MSSLAIARVAAAGLRKIGALAEARVRILALGPRTMARELLPGAARRPSMSARAVRLSDAKTSSMQSPRDVGCRVRPQLIRAAVGDNHGC